MVKIDKLQDPALAVPEIRNAKLGRSTFGEVLARQPVFGIEGPGPLAKRELVPLTDGARQLLQGDRGAAVEQALRGVLSVAPDGAREPMIRTIALSTGRDGYASTMVLPLIAAYEAWAGEDGFDRKELRILFKTVLPHALEAARRSGGMHLDGNIALGPQSSRMIRRAAAGDLGDMSASAAARSAHVVNHEVEHAITPRSELARTRPFSSEWEEGVAETTARWPGRLDRTQRMLGLPTVPAGFWAYPERTQAVRAMLRLAGVDPHRQGDEPGARELLQGHQVHLAPGRLAKAIIAEHGLGDDVYEPLRVRLRDAMATPSLAAVRDVAVQFLPPRA